MELNENLKNKIKYDENKCINCKLCFHNCPMMKEFENSPKDLMNRILTGSIDIRKVAYSCMLCGLCTSKCPKGIDLKSTFYKIRKYAVLNNKITYPAIIHKVFINSFENTPIEPIAAI